MVGIPVSTLERGTHLLGAKGPYLFLFTAPVIGGKPRLVGLVTGTVNRNGVKRFMVAGVRSSDLRKSIEEPKFLDALRGGTSVLAELENNRRGAKQRSWARLKDRIRLGQRLGKPRRTR